jgi:hypothetical protein
MYFDRAIHIEPEDQCFTCEYFAKHVRCPLLEGLATGVVKLEDDVVVQNCGLYQPYQRHLSVVRATEALEEETETPAMPAIPPDVRPTSRRSNITPLRKTGA